MGRWIPMVLLGALAACGGHGGTAGGWSGTMDTLPSGRVVVTNPASGVWDSTTRWRVVEKVRIGAEEGNGPDVFGRLGAMMTDLAGRIWVLESQEQVLKVFEADGRFVRAVGRKGRGPGELANVAGLGLLPDGRVLVVDPQNARLSLFDTAGTFLSSQPVTAGYQVFPWPGRVLPDGSIYHVALGKRGSWSGTILVRYDSTMTPLDTLFPPRWQGEVNEFRLVDAGGARRITVDVPFSPGLQWNLAPDGTLWFVHTGTYELFQVSRTGDTVRAVTKPFTPVPVTRADRDTAVAQLARFTGQGGKVDVGRIPVTKPPVWNFTVAEDGYLWVAVTMADTTRVGREFDIFDPEGRYLGVVQLPFRLSPGSSLLVGGDRLIGETQNEDGVPFLVKARIER